MADDAATDGTIGKALEVLDEIAALGRPVRFSEVLEQSRFPKATLDRLIRTPTRSASASCGSATRPAALRAELRETRTRGYGFDREEHEPGIICVAFPVPPERGRAAGALSITTSTARLSLQSLEAFVPRMRATAETIAADARAWCFPS